MDERDLGDAKVDADELDHDVDVLEGDGKSARNEASANAAVDGKVILLAPDPNAAERAHWKRYRLSSSSPVVVHSRVKDAVHVVNGSQVDDQA